MSETNPQTTPTGDPDQATPPVAPKTQRRVSAAPKETPPPIAYRSARKSSVLFDVQIKGEIIYGQWDNAREHVMFLVPEHLAEGFETHWHFASGNVVLAD